jgi:hypothetical protein
MVHEVYVVVWPTTRVVKVGYSAHRRWRKFERRGADLVLLASHQSIEAAADAERAMRAVIAGTYPPAFSEASAAADHLGPSGGGWAECFRLPPEHCPEHEPSNALGMLRALLGGIHDTNVRTNVPTGEGFSPTRDHLALRDARARVRPADPDTAADLAFRRCHLSVVRSA